MTQSELKLMYGKIKKANQLLEEQAIKEGIDITSPQYDTLVAKVRNNVLQKNGFTLSQYQEADAQMKADKQKEKDKGDATFKQVMGQVKQLKGEKGEKGDTGEEGIQGEQGVQGEQGERGEKGENGRDGINGLDGKNGKDGRDGRDGRDGVDGQSYNPLDFNAIVEKVSKIPQKEDLEEYVKETVGYSLKASTEIMGMPNFRKLAMGLRNDIDQLQIQVNKGGGGGTGYSIENLSSQISAGNVTFTAVHFPVYLVVDNGTCFANEDFTISGDDVIGYTIVMSFPPTTSIRDFYGGGGSTPTVDYLTDSNGNILTDSNGSPLTVN